MEFPGTLLVVAISCWNASHVFVCGFPRVLPRLARHDGAAHAVSERRESHICDGHVGGLGFPPAAKVNLGSAVRHVIGLLDGD